MATLTSITSLSKPLSLENNNDNLRDVPFSSYVNSSEETFVRKLGESSQNLSPNLTAQEKHHDLERKNEEDGEIGVFGAEKYFNGGMDEDSATITNTVARKYHHEKVEENDVVVPIKPKVQTGTPSVHSESSSNSQSALLQNFVRNPSRRKMNKAPGKSFLAGLGCACSCSDKDSVDVNEREQVGEISFKKSPNPVVVQSKAMTEEHIKTSLDLEHKTHSGSWVKEDMHCGLSKENCFTFPTLNSVAAGNLPIKKQLQDEEALKPRKSLEVFGSPIYEKRKKSFSLERRLTMLSWDLTPRMEETEFSATSGGVYNDDESDASSDLFEIESLTGKVTPLLARQVSDATSGCLTPTTCYAPSEASIEWSVVTASAADCSAMSDYEELRPPTALSPITALRTTTDAKTKTTKEIQRRRPSILLGCKSQKAVRVVGDAHKTSDKASFDPRMRQLSDSYVPVTRFQAETKLAGFDSKQRQHALATHSFRQSHSPHNSHLLYIQ